MQHVSFGTVLGDDGRPFKTRSGDTVGLEGLLDEAVRRALEIVSANDDAKPDGPRTLRSASGGRSPKRVGIAALKYADLSQNRTSDYVFSYDKMLAMNGQHRHVHAVRLRPRAQHLLARATSTPPRCAPAGAADPAAIARPNGRWPSNCSASPKPST